MVLLAIIGNSRTQENKDPETKLMIHDGSTFASILQHIAPLIFKRSAEYLTSKQHLLSSDALKSLTQIKVMEKEFTEDQKQKRSYYSVLAELALIDEDLSDAERDHLLDQAEAYDVSKVEAIQLLEGKKVVEFIEPTTKEEQFKLLYNLVKIMMMDGFIHEKEMKFCKDFARKLGYKKYVSDSIIPAMISYVLNNAPAMVAMNSIMDPSYWPNTIKLADQQSDED